MCPRGRRLPEIVASTREYAEQVMHFLSHFLGRGDGIGDFLPEELAIALAKAVDGHFHGPFGHAELCGQRRIGLGLAVSDQARFERVEHFPGARRRVLFAQPVQGLLKQCESPAPFKALLGRQRVRGLLTISRLR